MAASDADIIAASLADPVCFAAIFDRHIDPVRRFVVRRVGASRGDDVISEVFRVGFERRHTFLPDADSALPWLYGIAANLVRHDHRSTARGVAALERLGHRTRSAIDPLLDVAGQLDAENEVLELRDALLALREEEREVLLLVAWEQLSPTEAAQTLGIDAGTARTRLHRARRNIRARLARDTNPDTEPDPFDQEVSSDAN
jgi:RNA polymerase sigma-70 factor (ECF subfamily)